MAPRDNNRSDQDERDLIRAAQGGDYDAFEGLVERYRDRVYRLAYGMIKNESEAEEVVQDAFLNVFRNIDQYRGDSSPGSWIYRVAANSALMRLRTKRRKPLLSIEDQSPQPGGAKGSIWPGGDFGRAPDASYMDGELREKIEEAVAQLPEKYRLVLLLRDVEGMNNVEVAEASGLTVPTVKARLHRARMYVRNELEKYFEAK